MEKHELSKIDFEIIDNALNALLQSRPDPVAADKIADLKPEPCVGGRDDERPSAHFGHRLHRESKRGLNPDAFLFRGRRGLRPLRSHRSGPKGRP